MGEKINTYRILMGKPEGKRPLGKPRYRSKNFRIRIKETG
jgi:hypothetical protein